MLSAVWPMQCASFKYKQLLRLLIEYTNVYQGEHSISTLLCWGLAKPKTVCNFGRAHFYPLLSRSRMEDILEDGAELRTITLITFRKVFKKPLRCKKQIRKCCILLACLLPLVVCLLEVWLWETFSSSFYNNWGRRTMKEPQKSQELREDVKIHE